MAALYLTEDNFDVVLKETKQPLFIDFWATWCGPCKAIAPLLDEVAKDFDGKAVFAKVNVDECPNITSRFGIMSIPTVIFFKNGEITAKEIGVKSKAVYNSHLDNLTK